MPLNRLTQRQVETLKRRGRHGDGGGLVLQISKWGTKAWVFRYLFDGRERHMGLGPLHAISLAKARDLARGCRALVRDGVDPVEQRHGERHQRRLEAARHVTFRECAEQYIAAHRTGWRNAKHREQWNSTLAAFAYPAIGSLSVAAVDTGLVLKCLEPIWQKTPETAKRLRGRIESILDAAAARGLRRGENPARWRGHLDKLLPAREGPSGRTPPCAAVCRSSDVHLGAA
jgi:hypothetical protein